MCISAYLSHKVSSKPHLHYCIVLQIARCAYKSRLLTPALYCKYSVLTSRMCGCMPRVSNLWLLQLIASLCLYLAWWHTKICSPDVAAFIGFAAQVKLAWFESAGVSALRTLHFNNSNPGYIMNRNFSRLGCAGSLCRSVSGLSISSSVPVHKFHHYLLSFF